MKYEVFYGKGMGKVKKEYPDIYEAIKSLNEVVYSGKSIRL